MQMHMALNLLAVLISLCRLEKLNRWHRVGVSSNIFNEFLSCDSCQLVCMLLKLFDFRCFDGLLFKKAVMLYDAMKC